MVFKKRQQKNKQPDFMHERGQRLAKELQITGIEMPEQIYQVKKDKASLFSLSHICYGLLLVLLVGFQCIFSVSRVSGHSMDPTLHDKQWIVFKRTTNVKRFDVVALRERLTDNGNTKQIVKRIIGLPGDHVTVVHGKLYVNERLVEEKYLNAKYLKDFSKQSFTITVPKDRVFVLGDNRDVSQDSRAVGSFKKSSIIGVKVATFF